MLAHIGSAARFAAAFIILLPSAAQSLHGDDSAAKPGRARALLIGCGEYEKARRLDFISRDVEQLRETLVRRCGYDPLDVVMLRDDAGDERRPTQKVIESAVTEFLAAGTPGDRVLVYFSGHGFKAADGKMYLAPLECDPTAPEKNGIPVQWLRSQLSACPAGFKLLILDACHAGSERSAGDKTKQAPANSEAIGQQFGDLANVVTIASSTGDQPSQIWDEKQHSLFTYWLNEAFKGHADASGDGEVNIDELFDFVHRAVSRTSKLRLGRVQTPVRIVRSEIDGVPAVVRLKPQPLDTVLADIAEQLADKLIERQASKVGVLEFINDTEGGELLGKEFGLLGSYCADKVHEQLIDLGTGRFSVVDRRRLDGALRSSNFQLAGLSSDSELYALSQAAGGMPVIVIGKLKGDHRTGPDRNPRVLHIQCKLTQTEGSADLGAAGGTAVLNESQWGMIGKSVVFDPDDRRPERTPPGEERPIEDKVVRRAEERSNGPHPFTDPKFPFRVKITVDGRERPGRAAGENGKDWVVELRKGEVYEIIVENSGKQAAALRLLIDGLNTMVERENTKGIETWITGKRVGLDTARPWIIDPADPDTDKLNGVSRWLIPGFVGSPEVESEIRRFTVVDAAQSLAARRKFSDQIGLITAGFYVLSGGQARDIGTDAGERVERELKQAQGGAGVPIAIVHIKYVEAQ